MGGGGRIVGLGEFDVVFGERVSEPDARGNAADEENREDDDYESRCLVLKWPKKKTKTGCDISLFAILIYIILLYHSSLA